MLLKINRCPYTGDNEKLFARSVSLPNPSSIQQQIHQLKPRRWKSTSYLSYTQDSPGSNWFEEEDEALLTAFGKKSSSSYDRYPTRQYGTPEALNLYSFVAHLTRDSVSNFSLWAIWSFRNILEVEPRTAAPVWHAKEAQKTAPMLDARIPVVAIWIDLIGEKLICYDDYRGRGAQGNGSWAKKRAGF
ncbi:hypothetical protein BKA61DRAFT_681595 [Leptodontidium sp. MPI-SDFR-AT-0119]|nr:hypothetical protein BKA61DRAFT_681595 [Leptodontidium sp. MPI-SDFR-AT-0119]